MRSKFSWSHRALPAFLAVSLVGPLTGAPRNPSENELRLLQSTRVEGPVAQATWPALTVDTASREAVRQFHLAIYRASDGRSLQWTGNHSSGSAGTTSTEFKDAVLLRINVFRALAGIPAAVSLNSTYSAKAQQAALMMSVNGQLSHEPPSNWTAYTAEGADAARNSNLSLGSNGPDAITGYIADPGSGNAAVGHRRWLLYPQTREMGTGDVPAAGTFAAANATWVFDPLFGTTRPSTRTDYVAWPAAGYLPDELIFPRWSFSYPNANFSGATVTLTRDGASVPVTLEPVTANIGENTLVWIPENRDTDSLTPLSVTTDSTFRVTINNVVINGTARSFTYEVIAFDPARAGGDFQPVTVSGNPAPATGAASTYTVTRPTFADTLQWRSLQFDTAIPVYNAESGLAGLTATTTGSYPARTTSTVGAGSGSYQLATPTFADQYLTSPETFYAAGTDAQLTLLSRLGFATTGQTARIQISLDDGVSWTDVYTQSGIGGNTESTFTARSISLASFAGQTFKVRFAYTYTPGQSVFPQTEPGVGWFFDNITLTNVQRVAGASDPASSSGTTFNFTPTSTASVGLQARGALFSTFPMAWGPVLALAPVTAPPTPSNSRIVNLAARGRVGTGDNVLIAGFVLNGTPAKALLIQGVGPTLTTLGVTGALADPQLELKSSAGVTLDANDNWSGQTALRSALGATQLDASSKDAALLTTTLAPGPYSVIIRGTNETSGVALAELYDTNSAGGARLVNIAARAHVGTGADTLFAGFVIVGNGPVRVLVRALGPALTALGVSGALVDPQLEVYRSVNGVSTRIEVNDDWDASLASTFATVGAQPLTTAKDSALLLTLEPGVYSTQVSGVANATGVALVEVYEVP